MTSKSSLPVSLQPLPLAAYLTGAVGSTFLISAPQAEAAVTSVTFGFGSVLSVSTNRTGVTSTNPNLGGFGYGTVNANNGTLYLAYTYFTVSYNSYVGAAKFLANSTVVGNGANGTLGYAVFQHPSNPSRSFTTDQLNKNIGFRTTTNNFGWANVSWDATAKALTFNSAYVESVPNTPITIAAVPEPSRALLALAGLGAAALRRRRKQAA